MTFTNTNIRLATVKDVEPILNLLNTAYRGEESKVGWTTEADLISGAIRTTVEQLTQVFIKEGSIFLVYEEEEVLACVNLQQKENSNYLGMFAVQPHLQNAGIGKKLLQAAEEWTVYNDLESIHMVVISLRKELIDWYKRHGYIETGEKIAFAEDGISGKHLQTLEFSKLEKKL